MNITSKIFFALISSAALASGLSPALGPSSLKASRTQLSYQQSNDAESSTITLDPSKVVTKRTPKEHHGQKTRIDPIESIAFLNDQQRRYKKHRRPRVLSDYNRKKRVFAKALLKEQAKKNFQEGQEVAEKVIMSVLKEYNIQDKCILP